MCAHPHCTKKHVPTGVKYAFSFQVNNPRGGQPSPNILISTGVDECFPWAEPLALKTGFFVKDISTDQVRVC